jgi:lysophosphatidate acyltransferase
MSLTGYTVNFFVGYVGLVAALYMLSLVVPRAAFVARSLASYMALVVVASYGVFVSVLFTLLGQQGSSQWAAGRAFKWVMWLVTGILFVIDDPNDVLGTTRPAIFIGNHQTELDVLMLGTIFPKFCSVTAKASLRRVPVLGWFMSLSGTVFIDRKNTKDAREAMKGAAQEIASKRQSVYMFPEGTRSYAKDPVLLPFKKGAFHLAVQAGVPIVPVVVANYSNVLHIKSFIFRSGRIPVKVLDPIPTKGLTTADVDQLASTTRELMLQEMITLSEKAQGRPMAVPAGPSKGISSGVDAL